MKFKGSAKDANQSWDRTGILLVNLGTPAAPTPQALKRYLAEFLWDPRVVEIPRPIWWLILHGLILRLRPRKSARAYQSIWRKEAKEGEGSPLMYYSRRQQEKLQDLLARKGKTISVELAMRYGQPSIASALERLKEAQAGRIILLPLYPQYSCSTTASVLDAVYSELMSWRRIPELISINQYHLEPTYIAALSNCVSEHWQANGRGEKLVFSFHGTPRHFADRGDPYARQCQETAARVAEQLRLDDADWVITFQSRFGKAEWLKPYTDKTLQKLAKEGVARVDVICPGFSADCLETLEEIKEENREYFLKAGGKEFFYIPALNDRDDHVQALERLVSHYL